MYSRMILSDISRSKTITSVTVLFIAASAALTALAGTLVVNLSGAIDDLMYRAKTPHYMQMHSGNLDAPGLAAFAAGNVLVEDFQVQEFLNVDGARIVIGEASFAGSVQDNGLCVQNESFDFLLDLDGKVIRPSPGELYVPINYRKEGAAAVGDKAVIHGKEFTVEGFLRDSQMNSLLASSKRFLVHESDYAELRDLGSVEYLIEFRLRDPEALGAFEAAYTSAGLPANGPTITYPLFRMMNALADGFLIALVLLVGALVVAIAFLCLRFTILAKIEDEYREIGVMKAVGLRVSDIRRLYLSKYLALSAAGCLLGYALSFAFRDSLLENIRLNFGRSGNPAAASLAALLGPAAVFLAVIAYIRGLLGRFRKISASEALRFGVSQEGSAKARRFRMSGARGLPANLFLGVQDVLARKKLYATMLAVLAISVFIGIVPENLRSTISSPGFSRYLGIGKSDLRIDIQQAEDIAGKAAEISRALAEDPSVAKHTVLTTRVFTLRTAAGPEERIKVELGDHSAFPVEYSKGRAPAGEGEIALSEINARDLGLGVGGIAVLDVGGQDRTFRVSGIYSDVTNGGKTAKASFRDDFPDVMWSVICVNLADRADLDRKVREYSGRFGYAKVSDIDYYVAQTFGPTIRSVGTASAASAAVALGAAGLLTLLFMRMIATKDRYSIAVLKALGFTNRDIAVQYATRAGLVLAAGILAGTLLANTLGQGLAGAVISSFGASSFAFEIDPVSSYLIRPLLTAAVVLAATLIAASGAGRVGIPENIKE